MLWQIVKWGTITVSIIGYVASILGVYVLIFTNIGGESMSFVPTHKILRAYKILQIEKKMRHQDFLAYPKKRERKMAEMDFVMKVLEDLSGIPIEQPETKQESLL